MTTKQTIAAIVPAAGVGARMGHNTPKQYIQLAGKTILEHTLAKLGCIPQLSQIVVAVSDDDVYFPQLKFNEPRITQVAGGKERADSVLNSLMSLQNNPPHWVLVHDAARPLVTIDDIQQLISQCLQANEGGILASKVKDTIKQGSSHAQHTVPRENLWQALTPQLFKYHELKHALHTALAQNITITDEASAMEWANKPVQLISGRSDNIKITTPEDLDLADFLIKKQKSESAL